MTQENDRPVQRSSPLSTLRIDCPNHHCPISDTFSNIRLHIRTCEYRKVTCPKCFMKYPYNEQKKHDQNHTIASPLFGERQLSAFGKRADQPNDTLEDLCSKYAGEGPRVTGPIQGRECQPPEQTQNRGSQFVAYFQEGTAMMVAKVVALTEQITRSQCRVVQLTADVEELTAINAYLSEDSVNLERSLKDLQEDSGVVAMQEQMMHQQGDYIMKVESLSHLQEDCQAFSPRQMFGEAFLTSEAGYLMRLILYPCGRDSGQGTHLSVSFQIMQGPFDDVLPWPFTGEVAISLLPHGADQGGPPHTQVIRDGPHDCLQRATSAPNQERGEARFFPLRSLLEGGPFSHGDRLFLKISVRGPD